MLHLKQENTFRWLDIKFLKSQYLDSLPYCLTTFASLEAKQSIVQLQFYGTITKSPMRCAFWGSDKCKSLRLAIAFMFL